MVSAILSHKQHITSGTGAGGRDWKVGGAAFVVSAKGVGWG